MKQLVATLDDPRIIRDFTDRDWDELLAQARRAAVVDRLHSVIEQHGLSPSTHPVAIDVFKGIRKYVAFLQKRLRFELGLLGQSLAVVDGPVVLLKGAAYIMSGSAAGRGRSIRDIDILVPERSIDPLEAALENNGWRQSITRGSHDDAYYRELAHELPPRRHPEFHFELDAHHNILEPRHRFAVPADKLFAASEALPQEPFRVLSPEDQIIHSAAHLTLSDDLHSGLRDTHDLALLLSSYLDGSGSWLDLERRARELRLAVPLRDATHLVARYFPKSCAVTRVGYVAARQSFRDKVIRDALEAEVFEAGGRRGFRRWLAATMLLARAKMLRLPPRTLLKHLLGKKLSRGK